MDSEFSLLATSSDSASKRVSFRAILLQKSVGPEKGEEGVCSACDQPIQPHDNEYEIVLREALATAGSLLFHRTCLDIWIAESPH